MARCCLNVIAITLAVAIVVVVLVLVGLVPVSVTTQDEPIIQRTEPSLATPTALPVIDVSVTEPGSASPVTPIDARSDVNCREETWTGNELRVTLTEGDLTRLINEYLSVHEGLPVEVRRSEIRDQQIIVVGDVSQLLFTIEFTVTGYPIVESGNLIVVVERVEPSLLTLLGSIYPGDRIAVPLTIRVSTIEMGEGYILVTGYCS